MEKNNIPLLTIVRGFPGSGKTTFGRKLAEKRNGLFVEPDMFMYDREGVYHYTSILFRSAVRAAKNVIASCYDEGETSVVYADVLPTRESVLRLINRIQRAPLNMPPTYVREDIDYEVIDMPKITYEEAKARNIHNVCEEDLKRMFAEWEDWQ